MNARNADPDMLYLAGDLAKLGFLIDPKIMEFSTSFYKECKQIHESYLVSQLGFLKTTLSSLWRMRAEEFLKSSSYDAAIDSFKKALDLNSEDYTLDWKIGKCYEKMGQELEALIWYVQSAKKRNTSRGYRILSALIRDKYRIARARYAPANLRLKYLELQENALKKALEVETTEEESWGMLAEVLRDKGRILAELKDYDEAVAELGRAMQAYETGLGLVKGSDLRATCWYYGRIGYCYNDLKNSYLQLKRPESKVCLKKSMEYFKKAAEIDSDTNRGNLQLAKVMSWEEFHMMEPDACGLALAKIKTDELSRENLIEYYVLSGLNHENKGQFQEALNCFEFAKEKTLELFKSADSIDVAILEEKIRSLVDKIYQHLGFCYANVGQLQTASENYTMYVNINAFSRKGISGKIYALYGKKLLRVGDYERAHFFVERAKKRNPSDARILSMMAFLDEKLGRIEHAIENLENSIKLLRSKELEREHILTFIKRERLADTAALEARKKQND